MPTGSRHAHLDRSKKRQKKSRWVKSYEASMRLVRLANDWSPRPVDARWQTAVVIAQREATQHFFRKVIDRDTKRTLCYVKHCLRTGRPDPGKFPDVHCAWLLRYKADLLRRATLEARLLAGQTIAETAAACKVPVKVVRLYESLFFCVMDKLKHPCFIIPQAISPRFWTGFTEVDVDILIKSMAYLRGPLFLEYVLPYFTTTWHIPDRLDHLTVPELENLQKLVQIRALVGAMTMSPMRSLKEFARRTVDEPATQWALLATEFQPLIDAAVEQGRLISTATSLSPTSMARLFESYREVPAAAGDCNHFPEPVLLVS